MEKFRRISYVIAVFISCIGACSIDTEGLFMPMLILTVAPVIYILLCEKVVCSKWMEKRSKNWRKA